MNAAENKYVLAVIINEGFDYAFIHYDDFEQVIDPEFHKLRLEYIRAREALSKYVKFEDEEDIHNLNATALRDKIKELPDNMIIRIVLINTYQPHQLEEQREHIDILASDMKQLISRHNGEIVPELMSLSMSTLLGANGLKALEEKYGIKWEAKN